MSLRQQASSQTDTSDSHIRAYSSWLQLKAKENASRAARFAAQTGAKGRSAYPNRIVVVDDEFNVAVTLAEILERHGYLSIWFTESCQVVPFVREHRPDLLLTDLTMPGVDGIDLAERVTRMYPDCRVILLTALADSERVLRRIHDSESKIAVEIKPVPVGQLLNCIEALLLPPPQRSKSDNDQGLVSGV